MNRYFYCYSYPLKEFLIFHRHRYITSSVNAKTHKKFWVFEGTEELNKLLEEWKVRKTLN